MQMITKCLTLCVILVLYRPALPLKTFTELVASLADDDSVDLDDLMSSRDVYNTALSSASDSDILYSELELIASAEEHEMEDEESSDSVLLSTEEEEDSADYPHFINWEDKGVVHPTIYQGGCGACGWISGTQALEARVAIVSENYIPYSIQDFMNCGGKPCGGAQPYRVCNIVRLTGRVTPETEIPYTRRKCLADNSCDAKCGRTHPYNYTNALHDQHVFVAGSRRFYTEADLIAALQDGPITTCFSRNTRAEGEFCGKGCGHANSVVGYSDTNLIVKENYSKKWGPFKNGTWVTPRGSLCAEAISNKGAHPVVHYDLDRANAFYTEIEGGVDESGVKLVDKDEYGVSLNDTKNWGLAKNKCSFLGSACKGVIAASLGTFELVSEFGKGAAARPIKAFKKTQMVIYLKHVATGKYIGIKKKKKQYKVTTTSRAKAAAFFTSYARLVYYDNPKLHLVNNTLVEVSGTIRDIALRFEVENKRDWYLDNCVLSNVATGKVLTVDGYELSMADRYDNATSLEQRFKLGLSGNWEFWSSNLPDPLQLNKGSKQFLVSKKSRTLRLRWHGREIMTDSAFVLNNDVTWTDFVERNGDNVMTPTDCRLSHDSDGGGVYHLAVEGGKVVMISSGDGDTQNGWTFEYADM